MEIIGVSDTLILVTYTRMAGLETRRGNLLRAHVQGEMIYRTKRGAKTVRDVRTVSTDSRQLKHRNLALRKFLSESLPIVLVGMLLVVLLSTIFT